MTDRERWNLRGPVFSWWIEPTWYYRKCGAEACETEERGDSTTLEFNRDGALELQLHHNPDGSEYVVFREYDSAGRLIEMRHAVTANPAWRYRYDYDAQGRLTRVVALSGDSEHTLETYEYDAARRKKKTQHIDAAAQNRNTFWGIEGSTDACYSAAEPPAWPRSITNVSSRFN